MRTQRGRGRVRGRASRDRPSRRHKLAERAQRNLLQQVIISQATGHAQRKVRAEWLVTSRRIGTLRHAE